MQFEKQIVNCKVENYNYVISELLAITTLQY